MNPMISGVHLSMPVCELFGAGTCGKYLLREFVKRGQTRYVPTADNSLALADPETRALAQCRLATLDNDIDDPLIQFGGPELEQQTRFRGKPNVGYVFSEWNPITERQKDNLRVFDVVIAGSEWNAGVIRDCGIECHSVPQGVDTAIFKPLPRTFLKDKFVIYSGGKYEHRKAQDLVIRAIKVIQERHDDVLMMASWFNIFSSLDCYAEAKHEGVRIIGLPLLRHGELVTYMNQTDVGLFPNRCEGGTNLILMDYMACGRPVIANVSTGQADVVRDEWAIPILGSDEALVEQMIESVERLYQNRELGVELGGKAARAMQKWPWSTTADKILSSIEGGPI